MFSEYGRSRTLVDDVWPEVTSEHMQMQNAIIRLLKHVSKTDNLHVIIPVPSGNVVFHLSVCPSLIWLPLFLVVCA